MVLITAIGRRQGDPISPNTFITYLERVMENIQDNGTGVSVQGERINNLRFADDIDLLEYSQGRRPGGTGGTVPPKVEVGGRAMHWSPQYFGFRKRVIRHFG